MLSIHNNTTAFKANIVKNDYLISGINSAKDAAKNGKLDLAYQFYNALNTIKADDTFDTFEIKPINGIITRNNDAKPQEILINNKQEYKIRKHADAKSDDGSQCIAGILNFIRTRPLKIDKKTLSVYSDYIATKKTAEKAKKNAIETINHSLDTII